MGKSTTERSRERQARIYKNRKLHEQLKVEDRMRKNSANRKAAKERLNNENQRVLHRIKQRESKRKYRAKKKTLSELTNEVSFSNPEKQVIKNKMCKL